MKRICIIIIGLLVSSFVKNNVQNDIQKQHLKGKIKAITYYSGNDTSQITIFNSIGNFVENKYFMEGKVVDICKYEYDVQGKLMETNSVSWRTVYNYDGHGNLAETNRYKVEDGSLMQRILFYYKSNGSDSATVSFAGNGHMNYRSVINIKETGNKREIFYDADGRIERREEYTWDADYSVKSEILFQQLGDYASTESMKFQYENYDKQGNWIQKKVFGNSTNNIRKHDYEYVESYQRAIEYY
ncbi:MAG: hypothetical protein JWQ38_1449 [Flavipsychrobacter sp.]|nr:hypothetical protein [Flavipsychrobacter sp.]